MIDGQDISYEIQMNVIGDDNSTLVDLCFYKVSLGPNELTYITNIMITDDLAM